MNINSSIIKVCGMRDGQKIGAVEALGVDWIGFIFYPPSKRYVEAVPDYLPVNVKSVGVFVNESFKTILDKVELFALDIVQLHGDESPHLCQQLNDQGIQVMKAFGIGATFPSEKIAEYEDSCHYFLFDTSTASYGGSGSKFDWQLLQNYRGNTPFLLSGGICVADVEAIQAFLHPQWIGIDINSKFELSPAIKNIQSIQQFIKSLKQ